MATPSPQPHIDSLMDAPTTTEPIDLFGDNDITAQTNESTLISNPTNLTIPTTNNTKSNTDSPNDSHDESLHEMVQSILNDSDNEVVLNNLNNNGYNNIQYNMNTITNDNTASQLYRHSQINGTAQNDKDTPKLKENSKPLTTPTPKRKYVCEWRTVVFIRHGKSKWNAAEGNTIGKVVAAGQGLWEYYKNKKMREKNVKNTKQKSDVDIMDASLSREGILEALQLSQYLRQYNVGKQMKKYNTLFEDTRTQIDNIIKDASNNATDLDMTELKDCLAMLDKHKIDSLIHAHPPQDDDNLRLPQPAPCVGYQSFNVGDTDTNIESKLDDIDENMRANAVTSRSPSAKAPQNGANKFIEDLQSTNEMTEDTTPKRGTDSPSFSNHSSYQSLQDFSTDNTQWTNGVITKGNKKYMAPIGEPTLPMSAEYLVKILNGTELKCGIVVSNLRRAMSTAVICLRDRLLRRPYEKIQILGCLQEIGLNSDTRPLLFTKDHKPNLAKTEKTSALLRDHNMKELYSQRLSTKYYKGDASDKTAQQRLQEFALWLFAQRKYLHICVIGHSHWFQSFFKAYLPANISEDELPARVRVNKIRNCGVVAFRIMKKYVPSKSKRHGRHISFEIATDSITTLQFSLYSAPQTNHEKLLLRQRTFEESSDEDIVKEIKSIKEAIESEKNGTAAVTVNGVSLEQSVSNDTAPDEATETNNDNDQSENRPPIPGQPPPRVPDDNKNEILDVNKEDKPKEKEKGTRKKSNGFGVSLTKPKNWMSRAIGRFGKSDNEKSDNEKPEKNDSEQKEEKIINENIVSKQSMDGKANENKENVSQQNVNGTEQNKDNKNAMTELNQLGWELSNIENDTAVITDDEDYIQ